MAAIVYLLCAATCLLCAVLLLRSYWGNGGRLLLWSAFCFVGLTLDNVILFFDLIVFPEISLAVVRNGVALLGLALLLYGLVWEAD